MKTKDFESILRGVKGLREPGRDLWQGIENRIHTGAVPRKADRGRRVLLPILAAAAACILVLFSFLVLREFRAVSSDSGTALAESVKRQQKMLVREIKRAEKDYESAKQKLDTSLQRLGELYGAGFTEAAEQHLAGMGEVLAEIKQSSGGNRYESLNGSYELLSAYGDQLSFLRGTDNLIRSIMQTQE
ncbi:MAG: hypothetical protein E4H36_02010 [Spirochaetales bacterium]|nr:MAG: hypothetical protein E4H36_02010 [Spirochaetales bacterium]